jgi:hypothetical protein
MKIKRLTQAQRLKLVQVTVFSIGDTITAEQGIALLCSLFEDPINRIEASRFAELLNLITPPRRRPGRPPRISA